MNDETIAEGFFLEFWLTCILCFVYVSFTKNCIPDIHAALSTGIEV